MSDSIDLPAYLEHALAGLTNVEQIEPALGGLLAAARGLMSADSAYLLRRQGALVSLLASDGLPPPPEVDVPLVDAGPEGRAIARGVAIIDRAGGSPFTGRSDLALAVVPIVLRGAHVGALVATRASLFVPSELRWLRILAQIAAVAMENAQLLRNERRRARYGETVGELATIERVDVEPFCQRMAAVIREVMNADHTEVLLHRSTLGAADERGDLVRLGIAGAEGGPPDGARLHLADGGGLALAFAQSSPYRRGDISQNPKAPAELRARGMRSVLAVPIPGDSTPQGLLIVASRRPAVFNDDDSTFLRLVAERVGLLLRHAEVERERARTAARQEFLTVVSHELKTPVAVIKAYAEVLGRRAELNAWPAQDHRVVERVQEQADRMLVLIEQLLDLRRIEAGSLPLEVRRFDLVPLVRRGAEAIQATTTRHHIDVTAPPTLYVRADRRRLDEVLTNLLENAVKYSPHGGRIAIELSEDRDGSAHLSVADEGIGIPPSEHERVFDRFYQVGAGTYSQGHLGLGLGLYIAHEIVTRHGGRMWVESQLTHGSTFHVVLPAAPPRD